MKLIKQGEFLLDFTNSTAASDPMYQFLSALAVDLGEVEALVDVYEHFKPCARATLFQI